MPAGTPPNDIFLNGQWYNRNGQPYGQTYTPNRVLNTDASGEVVASPVSSTGLDVLSNSAPVDTSSILTDTDSAVMEQGGVVKQMGLGRLWAYILSKLSGANYIPVYNRKFYVSDRGSTATLPQGLLNGFGFTVDFVNGWTVSLSHNTAPASILIARNNALIGANVAFNIQSISNGGLVGSYSLATVNTGSIFEGVAMLPTDTTVSVNFKLVFFNPTGTTTGCFLTYW
jgi:hypothetical protein